MNLPKSRLATPRPSSKQLPRSQIGHTRQGKDKNKALQDQEKHKPVASTKAQIQERFLERFAQMHPALSIPPHFPSANGGQGIDASHAPGQSYFSARPFTTLPRIFPPDYFEPNMPKPEEQPVKKGDISSNVKDKPTEKAGEKGEEAHPEFVVLEAEEIAHVLSEVGDPKTSSARRQRLLSLLEVDIEDARLPQTVVMPQEEVCSKVDSCRRRSCSREPLQY